MIKRYDYSVFEDEMLPADTGKWVKWEDIKHLIQEPQATAEDESSLAWLEMALKMWPKSQPKNGGPVPPSSPESKTKDRWNHWVKVKHVDPRVLYLACWKYQKDYYDNGHYLKCLMNFLSPSAKLVPEFLPWAKEEFKRQQGGQ